jgi:glycerol-3-phosphate dehydrogenase (NAD(P)+)
MSDQAPPAAARISPPAPKIGVLGAGAWGSAIAKVLAEKQHAVDLWCREPDLAVEINTVQTNRRYLPGARLPRLITASTDLAAVADDKDYLFIAIPSLYLLSNVKKITTCNDIRDSRAVIVILTKGLIETANGIRLVTEAVEDQLPGTYRNRLVYVSGPSHAIEVARGKITGLISASRSGRNSIKVRELLSGGNLVVFSSLDVKGVQVSAALKNVVAIAFGMLDALKETSDRFGDNTESLLLAAGLNEIQALGRAMGATHPETFTSIAGVGDLDVTCRSVHSRNRRFGREIILRKLIEDCSSIDQVIEGLPQFGYIAEGVVTSKWVHELEGKLTLPIIGGVYRILNREVEPLAELSNMLERITAKSLGSGRRAARLFTRMRALGTHRRSEPA